MRKLRQIFDKLKPAPDEVERLALRETDVRYARSFEPMTPGPVLAVLLLALIGAAGIALAPVRLVVSSLRSSGRHGR